MLATLIAVLKDEGKTDLANVLNRSKFNFDPQWEFSGIVSNQRKLYSNLKVPIAFRSMVTGVLSDLSKIACSIYENDDTYHYLGINNVGVLAINLEEITFEERKVIVEQGSVFTSFMKYLADNADVPEVQKSFGFENVHLNFNYLDVIRQNRNDSGHPTSLLPLYLSFPFGQYRF